MMNTPPKSKKGLARTFIVLLLIAALVAAGVWAKYNLFKEDFLFAGTLEATKVDLSAQLPSTISEMKVREGDPVSRGQELVTLSCEDFLVASRLATENFERNLRLFKTGIVSQEAFDQFKSRKEDTDLKLKWCTIRSPIEGTVLSRFREPSEWVSPGVKLLTLANIKDIWTYIYVPQPDVSKLKVGQKLKGVVPEIAGKEFEGTIAKINAESEFTPKNVQTRSERTRLVYGVKISFRGANDDEILKPGMTIEMQLPKE